MTLTVGRTRSSRLPGLAGAWAVVIVALGLWWWWQPHRYPFTGQENVTTVLTLVPSSIVPPVIVAVGAWGVFAAWLARRRTADAAVVSTAVVFGLVFGLVVPGLAPLTLVGYAMAVLGPVVLLATLVAGAFRWRGGWAVVALFVLLGAVAWMTGFADGEVLARYGGLFLSTAAERLGPPAVLLLMLVGGLMWAAVGAVTLLRLRRDRPAPAWTRPDSAARWGKVAAVIAALCALPYGLHRLTWLTPWPLGIDPADLVTSPETRLHGTLLGLAALAGALLTMGLVSRWGEVWPRWTPVVRGRRVPIAAAVVPGALVAALFTVAAVPFTLSAIAQGMPLMILVFPFPVWGPALGAAVLGYALRRRGEVERTGTLGGS